MVQVGESIDNIRHYGYETNKRHLNQAGFARPTKFINFFAKERKYVLCALNYCALTKAVTIRVLWVHTIANKEWILKVQQLWKVWTSSICVDKIHCMENGAKIHCMEKRCSTEKRHKDRSMSRNIDEYAHHGHKTQSVLIKLQLDRTIRCFCIDKNDSNDIILLKCTYKMRL